MRRLTTALVIGLAAWGMSGAGAGATTSDTETYINTVPGAVSVCQSPIDGPSTGGVTVGPVTVPGQTVGTVVVPGIGGVCFFLPATPPTQASLQINDASGQAVLAQWFVFDTPNDSPSVGTPLASGVFCGSTTLSLPPSATRIAVGLGGTFVTAGSMNIVGVGAQGNCPNPTSGTVTATYP